MVPLLNNLRPKDTSSLRALACHFRNSDQWLSTAEDLDLQIVLNSALDLDDHIAFIPRAPAPIDALASGLSSSEAPVAPGAPFGQSSMARGG